MTDQEEPKGLGGWLILVGIGVVVGPFRLAFTVAPIYYGVFTDGTFEALTTPGAPEYHALWGPLLIGEAVYNSVVSVAAIWLIYLFFSKHYLFPRVYAAIAIAGVLFIPLDAWVASFVLVEEPMFDQQTTMEFLRSLVSAAIWVPYLYISRRARNTFVERRPGGPPAEPGDQP